ncbi:TonB-dependent receptor [Blastomonas sp. AAP53]|uniref:TonB-dependent receptor n=1 Tax=Blastomonas sp. AAP53 TaxID=1248760 RepID=UPI0012670696|nr:TonB-dependent receptor [Blastomonas sp. AAP53]
MSIQISRTGLNSSCAAIAIFMASLSIAQAQDASGTPMAASADAAEPEAGLSEIVVTAERRSENLQKTALAVSAVDGAALQAANISQPQDLSKLIPALKLSSSGGNGTQVTIRGVGNFAGNAYSEPAVAINLDGVYLARSGGPNGLFYDLERVEVLKGPQGTLYGRNATAGAINVIARKPTDTLSAEGAFTVGNYDLVRGEAAVNVPLAEGAALRVAGIFVRRDGYMSDGYNDDRSESIRAQLQLDMTDRLSVLLSGDYVHVGGNGTAGVFAPFLNPDDPYLGPTRDGTNAILTEASLAISRGGNPNLLPKVRDDGFVDMDNWGVSATISYDLDGVDLTVIPAYRRSDNSYLHYAAGFPITASELSKATSVEVRLGSSDASPIKWLVGGYYFDEALNFDLFANQGVAFNRTVPDLKTRSYAAFGQLTYSMTDTFRVTAGGRYTNERKTQSGVNGGPLPPVPAGFPGPAVAFYNLACAPYDAAASTCFGALDGVVRDSKVTWKAGVEYDAGDRSLLYANVATGFKAGGFYASLTPNTFKPETLTAYTVGSKNRFLDNTLQLNLEAFYWVYKDKQITHLGPILPGGFGLITENAGKADIYGAEIELLWQPVASDRFSANLQYLNSKYSDFTYRQSTATGVPNTACVTTPIAGAQAVQVDCSGRVASLSPKWTLNANYVHIFELGDGSSVDAQMGTQIQSGYWVGEEYLAGQFQKASMVSNASLTWHVSNDRFSLAAFVDNIEDRAIKAASFVQPVLGASFALLRAPRTFGLRGNFRF